MVSSRDRGHSGTEVKTKGETDGLKTPPASRTESEIILCCRLEGSSFPSQIKLACLSSSATEERGISEIQIKRFFKVLKSYQFIY